MQRWRRGAVPATSPVVSEVPGWSSRADAGGRTSGRASLVVRRRSGLSERAGSSSEAANINENSSHQQADVEALCRPGPCLATVTIATRAVAGAAARGCVGTACDPRIDGAERVRSGEADHTSGAILESVPRARRDECPPPYASLHARWCESHLLSPANRENPATRVPPARRRCPSRALSFHPIVTGVAASARRYQHGEAVAVGVCG